MKKRKGRVSMLTLLLCLIIIVLVCIVIKMMIPNQGDVVFKKVKDYKELERIYDGKKSSSKVMLTKILTLPLSIVYDLQYKSSYYGIYDSVNSTTSGSMFNTNTTQSVTNSSNSSSEDYSKTNIQVENVDEADVTKTDGEYIYSLSEDSVVITDVRNVANSKVVAKFTLKNESIPQELFVYEDKLVVIGQSNYENRSSITNLIMPYYSQSESTSIEVFDISDKEHPKSKKSLVINQPYYTSRAIDGNVYVLASGYLRENSDDKVDVSYVEDGSKKDIPFNNMYYIDDIYTKNQAIITGINLDNLNKSADIKSYFIDLYNTYISSDNIYMLSETSDYDDYVPLKWLFGLGGIPGLFKKVGDYGYDYEQKTTIYKFKIDGTDIKFKAKVEDNGKTINQFSMDEYEGNLRVAMYDEDGTRINIYDSNLKKLGQTESLAKGEKMYSSRFVQDRAYLVTYKTMDPLYVIDLSNTSAPKVLGELKIPGYSTYLHPYDENHIIGIGMDTKNVVNRNTSGKVVGVSTKIVGMKMALFDVTDVSNPTQMSAVSIGNSRTTSAILTNHKALLFSKEKNLIAIPVNNYTNDFELIETSQNIDTVISAYKNKEKNYIAEGYEVYNIDLKDGLVKKGTITHDLENTDGTYTYRTLTHLLRGMYIGDNLYTVSERMIKINKLDTLELLKEIKISNN